MLFVAIVKGDAFLISLSASLSFVYRRATDILELVLYPAMLLKLFISCMLQLVAVAGLLCPATPLPAWLTYAPK